MWVDPAWQAGNTYSGNWISIKFLGTYPSWLPSSALSHSSWLLSIWGEGENDDERTRRDCRAKRNEPKGPDRTSALGLSGEGGSTTG